MQNGTRSKTLFVGVDVHKDTHTAVGVSPFGEKLFEITLGNYAEDFKSLTDKVDETARGLRLSPYFGLEDCHGYGTRLSEHLISKYPVAHIPAVKVDRLRQKATHPEKSDSLDALGVVKVMMYDMENLPQYTLTPESKRAKQIREISLDREYLASERSKLKNQLHTILYRIWNTTYKDMFADPFSLKALRYWKRSRPDCDRFLAKMMKRKVVRMIEIRQEINELEKDMIELLKLGNYTIQTANGCGNVVAAEMIGEIGDVNRFKTPQALAKYAGCAPRECSSGKRRRWKKTFSGNRRLNRAFHRMALTQISRQGNESARRYYEKKKKEGKTKMQALVCLRRQLVNVIWCMLRNQTIYSCPQ